MKYKSKILPFILGFAIGISILGLVEYNRHNAEYFELERNYCIEDVGFLNKGTVVRFDQGMSESFSRYILYLNLSDAENIGRHQTETEKYGLIKPYWLHEPDSRCMESNESP